MNFALSKKDQCLLVGLLGIVFVFISWYFVYTPLKEETAILQTENIKLKDGKLADIAPTILHLLDMEIPKEMTGNILIEE